MSSPEKKPSRLLGRVALLCLGLFPAATGAAAIKEGEAFPKLDPAELRLLTRGAFPETAGKVVLVDFWASWCAPCKASFPMMAKLQRDFGPKGFVVVAVGIDEKAAAADAFVKKLSPDFPAVHDQGQTLVRKVEVPTMPTSYLIGRDGKVRFVHQGFHGDRTEAELRRQIETLVAEDRP
jgi:thiol-disulfide isomerase/thioredoxin